MTEASELCPCGSQGAYDNCCGPVIEGVRKAETAEQLMRSRYSAYTRGIMPYLYESTHPSHRKGYDHEGTKEWAANSEWHGLEIIATRGGGAADAIGEVEFKACYSGDGVDHIHHEVGRFRKMDDIWYFTDGRMVGLMPLHVEKIGRNEPCRCGSGKKYKKCCGA